MTLPLFEQGMQPVPWTVAIGASFIAAAIDVRTHRIPNVLTGPLLLAGLVWAGVVARWMGVAEALAGTVLVGLPFFVMWMLRAGGAGDAKMMMSLGAWLGVGNGVVTLLCVALAGGVVAFGYALARRQVLSTAGNLLAMVGSAVFLWRGGGKFQHRQEAIPAFKGSAGIPYGVAIFVGTCAAATVMLVWHGDLARIIHGE